MYCPKCKMELAGNNSTAYYVHDIIIHEEDFQNQIIDLTKEQIVDILVAITKSLYFDEN